MNDTSPAAHRGPARSTGPLRTDLWTWVIPAAVVAAAALGAANTLLTPAAATGSTVGLPSTGLLMAALTALAVTYAIATRRAKDRAAAAQTPAVTPATATVPRPATWTEDSL